MIELGELFNRIIPLDMLLRYPRKYVIRLRDLRRLQKQRQMEQHQSQMAATNFAPQNHAASIRNAQQVLNSSAIDDLVDELS